LEPFSEDKHVAFLTKFWHHHSKLREVNQKQLEIYATTLIKVFVKSISDKGKDFTGIPLQTRLLAEAFVEEVKAYRLSEKSAQELLVQVRLVDLYKKFIIEKINISKPKRKVAEKQYKGMILCDIGNIQNHQKLALGLLMPELDNMVLNLEEYDVLAPEAVSSFGIVKYVDDKLFFIHRTFAEYLVADFLVSQLTKQTRFLSEILHILFKIIM
jgi:hypothetical protein